MKRLRKLVDKEDLRFSRIASIGVLVTILLFFATCMALSIRGGPRS